MSDFSNEIDTEIAAASWEQSPDASSSTPTSNSADRQPTEIQTRIPTRLVSWYALCRLGYRFLQDGDTFVIYGILGPIDLEELFRYSERYQKADERDQGSRPPIQLPNERIPLGLEDDKPAYSARIAPGSTTPISSHTHPVTPNETKDSIMRPWVNQLLVSDTVHLGDVKKQPRGSRGGQRSSDTYNAWVKTTSLLQDGEGKEFRQLVFKSSGNYGLDIDDFQLVDENEHVVDSTTWLYYLTSGEVERHSFKLVRISVATSSEVPRDPGSEAFNDNENESIEGTFDEQSSDGETFERTMEAAKQMFCQSIGKGTLVRNMPPVLPTLPSMPFSNAAKDQIPFFAWPLTQNTGNSCHTDGTMALTRLLAMIDQSLKELGIIKDLHTFSTRDEVVYKCRVLQSVIEERVYVPTQEAKDPLPCAQPPSSNHRHRNPESEILATLLALSEDIFDLFLPPANWFLVPAVGAYWGALDSIMRTIKQSHGYRLWQGEASHAQTHNLESKLKCQLEDARRDVMMASETQIDTDRLTISPIGLEFLLITLLRNLHDHPIHPETDQKLDVVRHCRDKSTALRFAAVRDPRRRRFLEISALEEEMEALRIIFEVQTRTVKAFAQVLSPDFFSKDTTDREDLGYRKDMYGLEKRHLDTHIQSLAEDGKTLEILQRILTATRHDMKQMIEVLDEGHGKAIRVFTFVTLFFLPL
ncbi:hypothetical protein J7337_013446 [Fusarium musae]|uniref:DUF8035 domain-containing protein n=1 Tax=Fusarium musae TaxID=1042133 RepID=A0A9P8D4R2_9HYPO|nr:hypothetical protein J7337_013446 [Fusarium musae]KAG9495211.1 hypothetical protein J7337_013446 [Fusarium musae]